MNSERPEYNRDTNPYPSFGKKYDCECAVISLTSWKARINTVSKTLYSLLTQCKGFHIVLVLSEEEFPKMMDELPENLKLFVDNELIEILWVYKNYRSFKKVLFTMDKYRDVPVISADDDCIYTCNYAQELYDKWKNNKECKVCIYSTNKTKFITEGPCTLYKMDNDIISLCFNLFKNFSNLEDDTLYKTALKKLNIITYRLNKLYLPFKFHTLKAAIHPQYYKDPFYKKYIL